MLQTSYISVGSNLGDKIDNCKKGIAKIEQSPFMCLKSVSNFYSTEPVDHIEQGWFVNAAIKIKTSLEPLKLLKSIKLIEQDIGREPNLIRFGPRVLDLDIIFYEDQIIELEDLIIPHPRMHKRCFVLRSLCDINPQIIHPILKVSIKHILDEIDIKGQQVIPMT